METRDLIIDGQLVGQLSFPDNTPEHVWEKALASYNPTMTLGEEKACRIRLLEKETRDYLTLHYDPLERDGLQLILTNAIINEDIEAAGRVGEVGAWCFGIMVYNNSLITQINACESIEAVRAITWDFSQFDSSDPLVKTGEFDV